MFLCFIIFIIIIIIIILPIRNHFEADQWNVSVTRMASFFVFLVLLSLLPYPYVLLVLFFLSSFPLSLLIHSFLSLLFFLLSDLSCPLLMSFSHLLYSLYSLSSPSYIILCRTFVFLRSTASAIIALILLLDIWSDFYLQVELARFASSRWYVITNFHLREKEWVMGNTPFNCGICHLGDKTSLEKMTITPKFH